MGVCVDLSDRAVLFYIFMVGEETSFLLVKAIEEYVTICSDRVSTARESL